MIAYLLLFLLGIYALISFLIVTFVVKQAVKYSFNRAIVLVIAIITVTSPISYLTIEYFITKAAFNSYCNKEAGVWIYKTVDQWKKENPGVAETLRPYTDKDRPQKKAEVQVGAYERIGINQYLNPRFIWVLKEAGPTKTNVFKYTDEIIDVKTGEVMARCIDFSSGYGNPFLSTSYGLDSYKAWLSNDNCSCRDKNNTQFSAYRNSIENIGGK